MISHSDPPHGDQRMNRNSLIAKVENALRENALLAEDRAVTVKPQPEEIAHVILPLLLWCLDHAPFSARGLVGISAPPGTGKSVLSAWLAAAARALNLDQIAFLAVDGYHLPNVVLQSRTGTEPDGRIVSLLKLKGTPATFDAERLLADLQALKTSHEEIFLPGYSRVRHEPVPASIRIGSAARWVFVEGNFLFLDLPPWRSIRGLLDRRVYLDADDETLRAHLRERHEAAGRDAAWIEEHFRRTDGPNIQLVRTSARYADIVFRCAPSGRIRPVTG